eukprot:gene14612-16194_t
MLKANNNALFQDTNQNIVSIRQTEIRYYTTVYQSFATQAALIGGFTYGALQNSERGPEWRLDLDAFYALFAAATILAAVHIILCCLFLQVYGPGLSLYGRPGSMAKAADVLRSEQTMIVRSFVLMIVFFVASTALLFWSVLDYLAAVICSTALAAAVRYWWYFSHRIYSQLAWTDDGHNLADLINDDENPIHKLKGLLKEPAPINDTAEDIEMGSKSNKTMPMSTSPSSSSSAVVPCLMEGYMTRRNLLASGSSSKWERRYFILTVNGMLIMFKDRKEFRENGKSSMNEKSLSLEDYDLLFDLSKTSFSDLLTSFTTGEVRDLLSQTEKKFFFIMIEKGDEDMKHKKRFVFICDTEEELSFWKSSIINYQMKH